MTRNPTCPKLPQLTVLVLLMNNRVFPFSYKNYKGSQCLFIQSKVRLFCKTHPTSSLCPRKDPNETQKPKNEDDKMIMKIEVCTLPPSTVRIIHKLRKLMRQHENNPNVQCLRKLIFHVLSVRFEDAGRC